MLQRSDHSSDYTDDDYNVEYDYNAYYNNNNNNNSLIDPFESDYEGNSFANAANRSIYLALLNILYFVVAVIGVIGNAVVFRLVYTDVAQRRSVSNFLVANLAVVDVLLIVFNIPLPIDLEENLFFIQLHRFCQLTLEFLSCSTIITIFYERYRTVRGTALLPVDGRELLYILWLLSTIVALNFTLMLTLTPFHHAYTDYYNVFYVAFHVVYYQLPLIISLALVVRVVYIGRVKGEGRDDQSSTVLQCPDDHVMYALVVMFAIFCILKAVYFAVKLKVLNNYMFLLYNFSLLVDYHYAQDFVAFCFDCLKPAVYCFASKRLRDIFVAMPFLCCNFLMRITRLGGREPIFV